MEKTEYVSSHAQPRYITAECHVYEYVVHQANIAAVIANINALSASTNLKHEHKNSNSHTRSSVDEWVTYQSHVVFRAFRLWGRHFTLITSSYRRRTLCQVGKRRILFCRLRVCCYCFLPSLLLLLLLLDFPTSFSGRCFFFHCKLSVCFVTMLVKLVFVSLRIMLI